jgi:hypothetical protein
MNPWSALTVQEVLNQFNDSEVSAYESAQGDAQGVSLADIVAKVMDQVADAYAKGGQLIDATTGLAPASGTIPPGEKNRAIAIARWKYLLSIPTGKGLAENRADEAKRAEDYLNQIARREIRAPGGVAIARPGRCVNTKSFDGISST